jgi:histidinol-phosphatase (PHP family)
MHAPILYDMHMHTPLCKHARGEPEEYAAVAWQRGLKGIVFTCHNPTNDGWSPDVRMRMDEFDAYVTMVERAGLAWAGEVDVRLGLECDFYPGAEPGLREILERAEFHHVLGSIHPQIRDYRARYDRADPVAYQHIYFEHLARAAESGLFDTLSHPDLVKNLTPETWSYPQMEGAIGKCLDRIAAAGTAMELNTSGLHKALPEMNPGASMMAEMRLRDIPVVIGSDAHEPERVAADFLEAFTLIEQAGYRETHCVLSRNLIAIPIHQARQSLCAG